MTSSLEPAYDSLYAAAPNRIIWGRKPGRLLPLLSKYQQQQQGVALDAGCGDGKNAVYLERLGFDVVGCDISSYAIEGLHSRFESLGSSPRGTYRVQDVRDLDRTAMYDVIVSYGLYHCLPLEERVEIHRAIQSSLRIGGILVFTCLTDKIPLSRDHSTPGVALANDQELNNVLLGLERIDYYTGRIVESHLPTVGVHEHSAVWALCRRTK